MQLTWQEESGRNPFTRYLHSKGSVAIGCCFLEQDSYHYAGSDGVVRIGEEVTIE